MSSYKGVIIAESLSEKTILNSLEILQTKVEQVSKEHETPWLTQWTLHTVQIPENKIDKISEKISQSLDLTNGANWYADFRNEKHHYVIFPNKVFRLDRSNKSDYETMRAYGSSIGVPDHQLPTFTDLPISLLREFLVEAKKQTYANTKAKQSPSLRPHSHDYHYEAEIEGEKMTYHDTYFGGKNFLGEEVVYRGDGAPKWGMNYYGFILDDELTEELLDQALRPALMLTGQDENTLPLRGPKQFRNFGYLYTFQTEGDLSNFTGLEQISKNNKPIYRLHCHGGLIET
jgi:hypothetical protein